MVFARSFDWLRVICIAHAIRCYILIVHVAMVEISNMGYVVVLKENKDLEPSRTALAWYISCHAYDADAFAAIRFYAEIEDTSGD